MSEGKKCETCVYAERLDGEEVSFLRECTIVLPRFLDEEDSHIVREDSYCDLWVKRDKNV
jgi:hypothetical protein